MFASSGDEAVPLDDDLGKTVNLSERDSLIPGGIRISTAVLSARPFALWCPGRPGPNVPFMSISISLPSDATNHGLPTAVVEQMAPALATWVAANREALLAFWKHGASWTRQEVAVHIDSFGKLGPLPYREPRQERGG